MKELNPIPLRPNDTFRISQPSVTNLFTLFSTFFANEDVESEWLKIIILYSFISVSFYLK